MITQNIIDLQDRTFFVAAGKSRSYFVQSWETHGGLFSSLSYFRRFPKLSSCHGLVGQTHFFLFLVSRLTGVIKAC